MFNLNCKTVILVLVILAAITQDVDARRKILKGRKTITRTYYRALPIPGWAIIILCAAAQLIIGAIVFIIMKKAIVDAPVQHRYSQAKTSPPPEFTS